MSVWASTADGDVLAALYGGWPEFGEGRIRTVGLRPDALEMELDLSGEVAGAAGARLRVRLKLTCEGSLRADLPLVDLELLALRALPRRRGVLLELDGGASTGTVEAERLEARLLAVDPVDWGEEPERGFRLTATGL